MSESTYPGQPMDEPPKYDQQAQPAQPAYGNQPAQPAYGNQPAQPAYGNQPAQPAYGNQPAQPAYGNQPAQPAYGNQPMSQQASYHTNNNTIVMAQPAAATVIVQQAPPRPPSYLGLAIFTLLCCNLIFGLIALIFSIMSQNSLGEDDVEGARSKGKISMGLSVAGILLTVLGVVFAMVYVFVILPAQVISAFG